MPTENLNVFVAWTTINWEQFIIFLYKVTQGVNHAVERRSRELLNEGVSTSTDFTEKLWPKNGKRGAWKVSGTQGKFSVVKSLFTISLARIRSKQMLRKKAGCKQSRKTFLKGHSQLWDCADLNTTFASLPHPEIKCKIHHTCRIHQEIRFNLT